MQSKEFAVERLRPHNLLMPFSFERNVAYLKGKNASGRSALLRQAMIHDKSLIWRVAAAVGCILLVPIAMLVSQLDFVRSWSLVAQVLFIMSSGALAVAGEFFLSRWLVSPRLEKALAELEEAKAGASPAE